MTLEDLDRKYLWHPFTPMREWLSEPPLVIDRAEGNYLIDNHGNRYLDGVSSLWVNVHGHTHPAINAAISEQLSKVSHTTLLGLGSTPSILLAEKLISLVPPGLARVFFSDSGSTAVEIALKIAFQFQQLRGFPGRTKFLALKNAYHGDTIGSVSLGGIDGFHRIFHPLLFQTIHVDPTIPALRTAFAQHAEDLAAFILEPLVQGAAGMLLSPPGLLSEARNLCTDNGVLLIADEVATGFGRTGMMFACEHEAVTPDLMTVAKGLTGGYLPVAATLATEQVFRQFLGTTDSRLTFFHGHSFGGNALGCAAALASLDLFEKNHLLASLAPKIVHLRSQLANKLATIPSVFEIRQKGLMVGIELRRTPSQPYTTEEAIGARVCRVIRRHGVILRPLGSVVVIMPPLSISTEEIEKLVDATSLAIREATSEPHFASHPISSPPPITAPSPPPPRGIFLLATDTGAGKTTVATALLALARSRGLAALPFKPVETGASPFPADALRLRDAAAREDIPLELICPHSFPDPVAPALAAEKAGQCLSSSALLSASRRLSSYGDYLIVESAGGLLTPYSPNLTGADLAAAFGLPVLLIARNSLGTINHTSLAIAEIRRRQLPLAGLIFVATSPHTTPDQADNARLVESLTGIRAFGVLPFLTHPTPQNLANALAQILPANALFQPA
jgi:adenosylmethionine-8-amino-7-oxononanoate aminotransferase